MKLFAKKKAPDKAPQSVADSRVRRTKAGGYATVMSLLALAIVVVANLIVGRIPAQYTKIDLSQNRLFSISQQTREIVGNVKDDITIYVLSAPSRQNEVMGELLSRYSSMNGSIKIQYRDPVLYPNFASQYTDEPLSTGSLIVVSAKRHTAVDYGEIYINTYDYTTNAAGQMVPYIKDTSFDGERAVTSAIDFVVSDNLPKLYNITGHSERELPAAMLTSIEKQNMQLESLNLLSGDIPQDADCIILHDPQADISAEEADILRGYLSGGGNLLLVTMYSQAGRPNLEGLMAYYGAELVPGVVAEADSSRYIFQNNYYLNPILVQHDVTQPLIDNRRPVILVNAQGIQKTELARNTLSLQGLLSTSDSAYSKVDATTAETIEPEEGDISGPFHLAAVITDDTGARQSRIIWVTTGYLLDETVDALVSGSNSNFFLNALGWMTDRPESVTLHAKSLTVSPLVISSDRANTMTLLYVVILPVICILIGAAVVILRRRG
ncbi:MAG: Gldg family protein [Christensenellales bacterium]